MARPNADAPLLLAAPVAVKCDQSAVLDPTKTPTTTAAMPPSFNTVSNDCTVRQLMTAKNAIAPTATICRDPNCQSMVCPSKVKRELAQTAVMGKIADRNVAKPTPRIAIDPVPATTNRIQPNRNAASSPYACRR